MIPITISHTDVADADGQAIHIIVDAITSTQGSASTGVGSVGNGVESNSAAVTTVGLTAERFGTDPAGNVYSIAVRCTEPGEGESESKTLTVIVPHDMGE